MPVRERSEKATTLLELLIAMFVLGLLLTAVMTIYVTGYRSYRHGTQTAFAVRNGAIAFDLLSRQLRQCRKIYAPEGGTLTPTALAGGYNPARNQNTPFFFVKYNSALRENQTLALTVDRSLQMLQEMIYSPSFDPDNPSTWNVEDTKNLAAPVKNFTLQLFTPNPANPVNKLIQFNLSLSSRKTKIQFESKVKIQGGI